MNALDEVPAPERSTLTPPDLALVMAKHRDNRLGFAVLLAFFRNRGRFPRAAGEIDLAFVEEVAQQLAIVVPPGFVPSLMGRTAERHRAEIRAFFGFREATVADGERFEAWLRDHVAAVGAVPDQLAALLERRCRELSIEPPAADRVDRIVRAAIRAHDERFCAGILGRLVPATRELLEALLRPAAWHKAEDPPSDRSAGMMPALLLWLRGDPGKPSLASVQDALAKLELIRGIGLPADLFDGVLPHELERYRRRVAAEAPYELRRHPEAARLTWLAAFAHLHARTLTDDLADLLIETIHHIGARAERRVEHELLDDLKRVSGKPGLLFDLAGAVLAQPDGVVREVVFPVVSEETLQDLVREARATGSYQTTLRTVIRNSYKGHYRRMVPEILQRLEFRSNNTRHRPIIQALALLKHYAGTRIQTFPAEEAVPIDGIVQGLWRDAVIEKDAKGQQRVNRITYEICVLEALRDKLRCKEVWVVGANRYRNPDEDLPADFEAQRVPYYQALKLPLDADRFIADLQAEMREALHVLDAGMPRNRRVRIDRRRGREAWITVTPFDPQPEAPNLTAVKAETVAT